MTERTPERKYINRAVQDVMAESENLVDRGERRSERQSLISMAVYLIGRIAYLDRLADEGGKA